MRNLPDTTHELNVLTKLIRGESLMPELLACQRESLDRMAVKHKVRGVLATRILAEAEITREWAVWASMAVISLEQDNTRLKRALHKTISVIAEKFDEPVVLKGESLSLGGVRDSGDVDLLIPESDIIPVISLLESQGYTYVGFDRNMHIKMKEYRDWEALLKWSNQFEFREPETGSLVEIHTSFFEKGRVYDEDLSSLHANIPLFLKDSSRDSTSGLRFLCLEDRLLLLALHVVLKRTPVKRQFILRHVLDYRVLARTGLDWRRVAERAELFGITFYLSSMIHLCERFTGPIAPTGLLESLDSRLRARELWLRSRFTGCLIDINQYNSIQIFAFRYTAPFILKGTLRARLKAFFIVGLFMPSTYRLTQAYGFPGRSAIVAVLLVLEPLRFVLRLLLLPFRPFACMGNTEKKITSR